MSDLAELLERVKAATGPDRELDWDIQQSRFGIEQTDFHGTPRYTASIDAALALAERLLPGQHMTMGRNVHHQYWLCTFTYVNEEGAPSSNAQEMHKTSLPLAILAALLSALNTAEGGDE